jgi:hypothetical protein
MHWQTQNGLRRNSMLSNRRDYRPVKRVQLRHLALKVFYAPQLRELAHC